MEIPGYLPIRRHFKNNGKPIGYREASLDDLDEATPKVGYAQPMGFLLFKVNGWANSNGFHSGPLRVIILSLPTSNSNVGVPKSFFFSCFFNT